MVSYLIVGVNSYFYPRSPCGERRGAECVKIGVLSFLSTLSLRRATSATTSAKTRQSISIHALLAESDLFARLPVRPQSQISIHALLAESDQPLYIIISPYDNFYPRSPCGERPDYLQIDPNEISISIHALLAESDLTAKQLPAACRHFYPRSPCGERRLELFLYYQGNKISIHALLAESDGIGFLLVLLTLNFYPRSPCGERHGFLRGLPKEHLFLSTLSLRRATYHSRGLNKAEVIFLSTLSLRRATSLIVDCTAC